MEAPKFTNVEIQKCIALDQSIKIKSDSVSALKAKKLLKGWTVWNQLNLDQDTLALAKLQSDFINGNCRGAIEYKRMVDTAQITNKNLEETDNAIIPSGASEEKIYIALGAIILVVGMYVLLKNKK